MKAIFIRHGQSTGNAGIPCHNLLSIELTELGWQQASAVAGAWTEAPPLDRHVAVSSHPANGRSDHPAVSRRAGGGVADRGVHLSPSCALERHAERRSSATYRALLERGRSGLLRQRRCGEFQHAATPRRGSLGAACRFTISRPDLCFQPRAVHSGRVRCCYRVRIGRQRQDAWFLAQGRAASDQERRAGAVWLVGRAMAASWFMNSHQYVFRRLFNF